MGRRNDHTRKELKEMAIKAGTKLIEDKGLQNCSARKTSVRMVIDKNIFLELKIKSDYINNIKYQIR